jgi:protein TonB
VNQLSYNTGAFRAPHTREPQTKEQKIFGLAFALTVEAAIVYALLATLGVAPAPTVPGIIHGTVILEPPTTVDPPPPPPPNFEAPAVTTPVEPTITLDYVPPQERAITLPTDPPERQASLPPPVVKFTQARPLLATHSTPDYPPVSRRLSEQGTLRLRLSISAEGSVKDAMVEQSSGYPRLDDAAVQWVKGHWRYQPAMEGTRPVASTLSAIVTFKLQ